MTIFERAILGKTTRLFADLINLVEFGEYHILPSIVYTWENHEFSEFQRTHFDMPNTYSGKGICISWLNICFFIGIDRY